MPQPKSLFRQRKRAKTKRIIVTAQRNISNESPRILRYEIKDRASICGNISAHNNEINNIRKLWKMKLLVSQTKNVQFTADSQWLVVNVIERCLRQHQNYAYKT